MRPIDADALKERLCDLCTERDACTKERKALCDVLLTIDEMPTLRKLEKPDVQGRTVYKYRVNTPIRRGRRGKPSNGHLIASFGALMDLYVYRDKNDPLPDVEVIETVGVKTDNIQLNKVVFLTRAEAEEKLDAVRSEYTK